MPWKLITGGCIIEGGLLIETHYCDCIIEGGLLTHAMHVEAHYWTDSLYKGWPACYGGSVYTVANCIMTKSGFKTHCSCLITNA